ncbi:helix-turn-helix transcriptional regulator [uncultured Parolsenella sp.]|uniref:helix-turn-helix domain-containing protein n=1 Tax=uncultured Parolsenella sp. TaxID=2083008 RepID=UPI0025DE48F6|nr:helix-turn-helix transcriptional regulator [uncultured Parolsenella sp.]
MAIILHLDDIAQRRGYTVQEMADAVGISRVNMSHIKNGSVKAIRFSTLENLCKFLDCQPGDLIEYVPDNLDSIR